jgi:hypothetical protein
MMIEFKRAARVESGGLPAEPARRHAGLPHDHLDLATGLRLVWAARVGFRESLVGRAKPNEISQKIRPAFAQIQNEGN